MLRVIGITAAAAVAGLLAVGGAGGAVPNTLTVQVAPGTITAGQSAVAVQVFTNRRTISLASVVVTFTFPVSVSVTAPGCTPASGAAATVSCAVGPVGPGATAQKALSFIAPGPPGAFQVGGRAVWGRGADFVTAVSPAAQIFAADDPTHASTCSTGPGSLDAELNGQGTELPNLPVADPSLGLPCTPLSVGVVPSPPTSGFGTDIAIVDLPKLTEPATVVLTFRDGELPGSLANPNPLREIPDPLNLDPSTFIVVPSCVNGTVIPAGFDACIISVHPDDPDLDQDAGTFTLRVQGSGFGDPRFVG